MSAFEPHFWRTVSRHSTSEGVVSYQRCTCGRWRVMLCEPMTELYAVHEDRVA